MSWPYYFKDRLIIGNPKSDTAVVTLWTPMNVVARMADLSKFSIIGQLYTKRGINYLLRNIFLNPRIRKLVITGADLMGSGKELLKLASQSASQGRSLTLKDRPFQMQKKPDWLDENIPDSAIKEFFDHVNIIDKIGPISEDMIKKFEQESVSVSPWSETKTFPEEISMQTSVLPSEETFFVARGEKVWQTWIRLLADIMRFGVPSPMIHHYGTERTTEALNVSAVVYNEDPTYPELPKWFPYKKDDIKRYVKSFLQASRGDEAYTYGERLKAYPLDFMDLSSFSNLLKDWNTGKEDIRKIFAQAISKDKKRLNQQQLLVEKLKSFPENKGALAILWEPIIDNFGLREVWRTPCLTLVQAMIREKKLFLTAYFRSNDMFGGWPLNAFGLRAFQHETAKMIGDDISLGPLTTISHSAHMYESSWQMAQQLIRDHWKDVSCEWDRRGNLTIETDGDDIVVKHLSPQGAFIQEYRYDGRKIKAARDFCFKLESAGLFSTIGHAMHVARDIERAETAIKLGIKFESDTPLNFNTLTIRR